MSCCWPTATGDDLFGLVVAANELRQRLVGDVISYVVTRNINFTNVCFVGCKFCAFSVGPRDETAYFLSLDEVAHKCREAEEWGATEVCIQGGLPRDLPPFYYRDILRAVKSATPKMHAHAFSPMEMVYGVELTGMPHPRVSADAEGQRARHLAGHGGGDSRRQRAPRALAQQAEHARNGAR